MATGERYLRRSCDGGITGSRLFNRLAKNSYENTDILFTTTRCFLAGFQHRICPFEDHDKMTVHVSCLMGGNPKCLILQGEITEKEGSISSCRVLCFSLAGCDLVYKATRICLITGENYIFHIDLKTSSLPHHRWQRSAEHEKGIHSPRQVAIIECCHSGTDAPICGKRERNTPAYELSMNCTKLGHAESANVASDARSSPERRDKSFFL